MRKRTLETQTAILVVAGQLFLEKGYSLTTVDDIARQSNLTKRTIYGYFPDKRALFRGVIEQLVGNPWEFHLPYEAITTHDGLRNALLAVATAMNNVMSQPRYVQLLRVTITELPSQPELGELFQRGITRRSLQVLNGLLTTAEHHGLISMANPTLAAYQFIGGFVVSVFLDGLLQVQAGAVQRLSKGELTEYVDDFLLRLRINERLL